MLRPSVATVSTPRPWGGLLVARAIAQADGLLSTFCTVRATLGPSANSGALVCRAAIGGCSCATGWMKNARPILPDSAAVAGHDRFKNFLEFAKAFPFQIFNIIAPVMAQVYSPRNDGGGEKRLCHWCG